MACTSCKNKSYILMPCRVCQLLDNDSIPKFVKYCTTCGAYICVADQDNLLRRAAAALKNFFY